MSGLARILLERGVAVSGCEARDSLGVSALRALGATVHIGHSVEHLARRRHLRVHDRDQPRAGRVRGCARERHAGAAPGGCACRRTRGPAVRRDRRHAWQDDDDLAADRRRAGVRSRPVLRHRRKPLRDRPQRPPRHRRARHRRGRRERRLLPADPARPRPSSPTWRPTISRTTATWKGSSVPSSMFVDRIDHDGLLLTCADDPGARRVAATPGSPDAGCAATARAKRPTSASATVERPAGCRRVRRRRPRRRAAATSASARMVGRHMALNAAAALTMAAELGLDVDTVIRGVGDLRRRAPALRVARRRRRRTGLRRLRAPPDRDRRVAGPRPEPQRAPGRLIAVFQPGTYSRTQTFAAEFASALAIADIAVVMDVFPAREEPIPGVTGATISDLDPAVRPSRSSYEPRFRRVRRSRRRCRPSRRSGADDGHRQRVPALRRDP